jgi:hypothetical protein
MPRRRFGGARGAVIPWCRALSVLLLVSACEHQDPFRSGTVPDLGPRTTTPPVQLTYDLGPI